MKLIDKYLPSDYSDSVSKRIKSAEPLSPDCIFDEMFCNFPKPVDWLMKMRNALVKPFGLQGGGGFRNLIAERSDEEIIICKNDKHLCFWVGIYCSLPDDGWQEASVTTVVRFNNFLGKVYFTGIWVFHKLLVKSLFRKVARTRVTRVCATLKTKRLILRPWRESDAGDLFKYASDPDVGPRAGWPPHKSVEESLEIIKTVFSGEGMWAVELKETSEVIGSIGYLPASASNLDIEEGQCEIGYWIAKPYWNKGICTEALRAVVDYCFNVVGFTVLWGDYFPENPASGRVMEKCGFIDTGREVLCPGLEIGGDKPVKVMRLDYAI